MRKDVVYVGVQLLLFVLYTFDVVFYTWSLSNAFLAYVSMTLAGTGLSLVLIAMAQLNKSLSPFPSPKDGSHLITHGVYRLSRHPIYTGILCITFGYGVYKGSEWKLLVAVTLFVLFYFKSEYEESLLIDRFGNEYLEYMKTTNRFLPRLKG